MAGKHKASAATNAKQRAQNERHLAEAPPTPRSNTTVSQDRAIDETALSGVDRPSGRRHDKHDGAISQIGTGRTPLSEAQRSIRRAQGAPDGSQS